VLRNRESPCRGFNLSGRPRAGNSVNHWLREGTEVTVRLQGPDLCLLTCPVRPYARGYIHVVDTPYYAVTDAKGRFAIKAVLAGDYHVSVWHEGVGRLGKEAGPIEVRVAESGAQTLSFRVRIPVPATK
jgi:hypothetical protein